MSVDDVALGGDGALPDPDYEQRRAPQPRSHGCSVINVLNDANENFGVRNRDTLYERCRDYWHKHVGNPDDEPHVVDLEGELEDVAELPTARFDRDYVLLLSSSGWKCGTGVDDGYRQWYQYHLKLRERDEDGDLHKPPLALHIELMPQYHDLVYKDGESLDCVYGEGTRVVTWTTWADSGEAVERRAYRVLEAVFGDDAIDLEDRNEDSRRLAKAEAHVRFHIGWKSQVIESLENTKSLIAYGGESEIDAHQRRQQEGWLESRLESDRWHLVGFEPATYSREVKVYQASGWADRSPDDPFHHPKLEASFAGVDDGALPHVSEWDDVMGQLRQLVSAHLEWAGVEREQLVEDDYFAGPNAPAYDYQHPVGRREQLRERYEDVATEVYREALKQNTESLYDLLRVLTVENGATYDVLENRTGLARSTIRHHCRRLEGNGVVQRVGNPVLVVFPSLEVLEQASEIMREIKPDDTADDMAERAEKRRERRENADYPTGAEDGDQDGSDDNQDLGADRDVDELEGGDTDDVDRELWRQLSELEHVTGEHVAKAINRDLLERDHVKLRIDPYDWLPDR